MNFITIPIVLFLAFDSLIYLDLILILLRYSQFSES